MIDDEEALIITSSYSKIIPVLLGESPATTTPQLAFIRALSGEVEPSSAAQIAWRKFVFLQQTAFAQKQCESECLALNERLKKHERMLANLRSEQRDTKADNIKLKLELEEREQTIKSSILSRLNNFSPEDVKFLVACKFYGLDRDQLSRLHNSFIDANVDIDIMTALKLALQRVTPQGGWNPANAFGVYANTDGQ